MKANNNTKLKPLYYRIAHIERIDKRTREWYSNPLISFKETELEILDNYKNKQLILAEVTNKYIYHFDHAICRVAYRAIPRIDTEGFIWVGIFKLPDPDYEIHLNLNNLSKYCSSFK